MITLTKNRIKTGILIAALSLIQQSFDLVAQAAEIAGVKFEDSLKIDDTALVLNGVGLRKFAFFKVYAGALYLKEKSNSDLKVLDSSDPKTVRMQFLRTVSAKDIQKAWAEGYSKNCSKEICDQYKLQVDELNKLMLDCNEGDTLQFDFSAKTVRVSHNNKAIGTIEKEGFPRTILSIFLGKNPPNEALKKGFLGL